MVHYSKRAQYVALLWIRAETMSSVEDTSTDRAKTCCPHVLSPLCAIGYVGKVPHNTPKLAPMTSHPRTAAM